MFEKRNYRVWAALPPVLVVLLFYGGVATNFAYFSPVWFLLGLLISLAAVGIECAVLWISAGQSAAIPKQGRLENRRRFEEWMAGQEGYPSQTREKESVETIFWDDPYICHECGAAYDKKRPFSHLCSECRRKHLHGWIGFFILIAFVLAGYLASIAYGMGGNALPGLVVLTVAGAMATVYGLFRLVIKAQKTQG